MSDIIVSHEKFLHTLFSVPCQAASTTFFLRRLNTPPICVEPEGVCGSLTVSLLPPVVGVGVDSRAVSVAAGGGGAVETTVGLPVSLGTDFGGSTVRKKAMYFYLF